MSEPQKPKSEPTAEPTAATPSSEGGSGPNRALHRSGWLLIAGLVAEALSLFGLHTPAGFIAFAIFGAGLITAGILTYLWSLVSATS